MPALSTAEKKARLVGARQDVRDAKAALVQATREFRAAARVSNAANRALDKAKARLTKLRS